MKKAVMHVVSLLMIFALIVPFEVITSMAEAQEAGAKPAFKQEELDQMLAPIALYPDALLTQMLMASTYPLEIIQADRWVKQNKSLKGDALTAALEKQDWDPSIKSMVNFPDVLAKMSEKLDWTQKLGDAFLAQQADVLSTVQKLRKKAEDAGNLKSSKEQVVKVEKEVIIIEPSNPQVIYVPTYNPTVVYGTWWYPAYPPYPYYPPGYYYPPVATPYAVAAGVALGVAWGYAWGHSNWHGGKVTYNYNQNININRNINRGNYANQLPAGGQGNWQHNVNHRGGVAYRDQKTAQQYNRGAGSEAAKSRDAYRGRAEQGRQDLSRGGADGFRGGQGQGAGSRQGQGQVSDRAGSKQGGGSAFSGMDRGGSATRDASSRGSSSFSGGSSSRSGGGGSGGGGGSRGGGGGSRGGGGGGRK